MILSYPDSNLPYVRLLTTSSSEQYHNNICLDRRSCWMQTSDTAYVNEHYELMPICSNPYSPKRNYQPTDTNSPNKSFNNSKDIARTTIIRSRIYTTVTNMSTYLRCQQISRQKSNIAQLTNLGTTTVYKNLQICGNSFDG